MNYDNLVENMSSCLFRSYFCFGSKKKLENVECYAFHLDIGKNEIEIFHQDPGTLFEMKATLKASNNVKMFVHSIFYELPGALARGFDCRTHFFTIRVDEVLQLKQKAI